MGQRTKLKATTAVASLDVMMASIHRPMNLLLEATHAAAVQYDGLCKAGGKCDEHAASLLREVFVRLQTLANQTRHLTDVVRESIFEPCEGE